MSANNPHVPHPLAGAPQAQTEAGSDWSPAMSQTEETEARPYGDVSSSQPINVPQIRLREGYQMPSLSSILGHEEGEAPQNVNEGFGPRFVVLHHFVTGPRVVEEGGSRPAFERGQVIWLTELFGDEASQKILDGDPALVKELRRYVTGVNPAIREANKQEARYSRVTFVEGAEALSTALEETQGRVASVESENERMRKVIEAIGLDPDASPEEVQRQLNARRAAQAEGRSVTPPQTPPASGANVTPPAPGTQTQTAPPLTPPATGEGEGGTGTPRF